MQRIFLRILVIGLLLSLPVINPAASAQSLGEIARENREKLAAAQDTTGVKPKVITNQDLGEGPEGRPDLRVQRPAGAWANNRAWGTNSDSRMGERQPNQRGEQPRRQIAEQENKVASLQARLDQINASARSNGQGSYGRYQSFQSERAAQVQLQLDEQKRKLDAMQDAARHSGGYNP